jgi:hypothetical protein
MSTKIQQQQVQGLVDAVASLDTVSGNLNTTGENLTFNLLTTGLNLENTIIATGNALNAVDTALTGVITTNTNAIVATGGFLDLEIGLLSGVVNNTGQFLTNLIAITGEAAIQFPRDLSGYLIETGLNLSGALMDTGSSFIAPISGSLETVSGDLDFTSGEIGEVSGVLKDVSGTVSGRLGVDDKVAANLGSGLTYGEKIYGETSMVVNQTCSSRVIQFMGDVPAGTAAGHSNSRLYVGGKNGELALMPQDSQWYVKMFVNARSIEPGDCKGCSPAEFDGRYGLETGFIIDHESIGTPKCTISLIMDGGVSGAAGDFVDKLGIVIHPGGTTEPNLAISGANQYTGAVRFHATAYISQLTGFQR